eukprot:7379797-Prymnesium_polylepis.2
MRADRVSCASGLGGLVARADRAASLALELRDGAIKEVGVEPPQPLQPVGAPGFVDRRLRMHPGKQRAARARDVGHVARQLVEQEVEATLASVLTALRRRHPRECWSRQVRRVVGNAGEHAAPQRRAPSEVCVVVLPLARRGEVGPLGALVLQQQRLRHERLRANKDRRRQYGLVLAALRHQHRKIVGPCGRGGTEACTRDAEVLVRHA